MIFSNKNKRKINTRETKHYTSIISTESPLLSRLRLPELLLSLLLLLLLLLLPLPPTLLEPRKVELFSNTMFLLLDFSESEATRFVIQLGTTLPDLIGEHFMKSKNIEKEFLKLLDN